MTVKNSYTKRHGALGFKLGMTRMPVNGKMLAVTAIDMSNCTVTNHVTEDQRGYTSVQVGIGSSKSIKKPQTDMFKKMNLHAFKHLREFRVLTLNGSVAIGEQIKASYFAQTDEKKPVYVDIASTSKGKGFAGGMKRWNFKGLRATHGVSVTHRHIGSTGNRTDPGRVFPGQKMPGHLGFERVTMRTLKVAHVDIENNVIYVHGSVPGSKGEVVSIRDAILG